MAREQRVNLSGLAETALAPLYWRALESRRPDALLKDECAEALVEQGRIDFSSVGKIPMNELLTVMRVLLTREMDRVVRDFLARQANAIVVHIGCGLDTRFERVDNGKVQWFDLDVQEIIALRREYLGTERGRYHLLPCSVFDNAWHAAIKAHASRPILFLAETVFVFFSRAQVKSLVLGLREHFPGCELVFDGWKPFEVWIGNRFFTLSNSGFPGHLQWGLWSGREIERWGDGIRLLDEWGYFDRPEPRLARFRWMAPLFRLFKPMLIYHFQLGAPQGQANLAYIGEET